MNEQKTDKNHNTTTDPVNCDLSLSLSDGLVFFFNEDIHGTAGLRRCHVGLFSY